MLRRTSDFVHYAQNLFKKKAIKMLCNECILENKPLKLGHEKSCLLAHTYTIMKGLNEAVHTQSLVNIIVVFCSAGLIEPRHDKTCLRGYRPGPTQSGLYTHRRWRGSLKFGFWLLPRS